MLSISLVSMEDTKAILEIYKPYILNTAITFETEVPSLDEFQARIDSLGFKYPYLVVKDDNKVIGYVYASPFHERAAYGWNVDWSIYIKEEYHRYHIATILFNALKDILKELGYLRIYALVTSANQVSMKLHEKLGFTKCGYWKHTGYKHNNWYDVTVYEYIIDEPEMPSPITYMVGLDKTKLLAIINKYNKELGEIKV